MGLQRMGLLIFREGGTREKHPITEDGGGGVSGPDEDGYLPQDLPEEPEKLQNLSMPHSRASGRRYSNGLGPSSHHQPTCPNKGWFL